MNTKESINRNGWMVAVALASMLVGGVGGTGIFSYIGNHQYQEVQKSVDQLSEQIREMNRETVKWRQDLSGRIAAVEKELELIRK